MSGKRIQQTSSFSHSTPRWKYDVFLSFRGEDTRITFTDHLYSALIRARIRVFRDQELEPGEEIASGQLNAIEKSRISIIILSKNYASSSWCMNELVKILENKKTTGQIVIPIFYYVDPSDVRSLSGNFREAFARHEKRLETKKVKRWRAALTEVTELSGWHIDGVAARGESVFIEAIVEAVLRRLNNMDLLVPEKTVNNWDVLSERLEHLRLKLNSPQSKNIRHIIGEVQKIGDANFISLALISEQQLMRLENALCSIHHALSSVKGKSIISKSRDSHYQYAIAVILKDLERTLLGVADDVKWPGLPDQTKLQNDQNQVVHLFYYFWNQSFEISKISSKLEYIARQIKCEISQEETQGNKLISSLSDVLKLANFFSFLGMLMLRVEGHLSNTAITEKFNRGSLGLGNVTIHVTIPLDGAYSRSKNVNSISIIQSGDVQAVHGISLPNVAISETYRSFHNLPKHLKTCFFYTSIFPRNYEFEKDTLVQLWNALGLIERTMEQKERRFGLVSERKQPEDIGSECFEELLSRSLFQEASLECPNSQSWYKVHEKVYSDLLQECSQPEYARVENDKPIDISPKTLHSSLLLGDNKDPKIFQTLYKAVEMQSLLLLNDYRSGIRQIPHDLFLKLRHLRVLDLSWSHIMHLPTSIDNLKFLSYLDLSDTPIRKLPDSLCSLDKLQTLKLRNCSDLTRLPNATSKLINLRHLNLDGACQLNSMPPRIGELTNLLTLSLFIVGRESGFQIWELKNLRQLRGSLCILNLENVNAMESVLKLSPDLHKLAFEWSILQDSAKEVLESLKPHKSLKKLKMVSYGGDHFPSWLGRSSLFQLTTISLSNCRKCALLPPLGQLPFLKSLCIEEMHAINKIDHKFYGNGSEEGFPKLETLELDGMSRVKNWSGIKAGDMPCLRILTIIDFPELVSLPKLSCLKSLQILKITLCPKLRSFPEDGLPKLQSLKIIECPILEEWCLKEGEERHNISEIPDVWIYYQQRSKANTTEQSTGMSINFIFTNFYIFQLLCYANGSYIYPYDLW